MTKAIVTILALTLIACGEPPPADTDAGFVLPDPVSVATYAPDLWDTVATVHPTECAPPGIHALDQETFLLATGACGSGACQGCAVCLSHVDDGAAIIIPEATHPRTLLYFVMANVYACEDVPFNDGEYQAARSVLGL